MVRDREMRLLSRYIMAELIKVFLVSLIGMSLVILLAVVGQEAVRQGLGPWPILRLIPYSLPNALVFAVPGTILFAVCTVYGRMSADNELVAAKSIGVSPWAFLIPGFVLAFLVSLGAVWLNDVASSWGHQGMQRVVLQSVEQVAYGMLRTSGSYSSPQFSINVVEVQGKRLIEPTVTFRSSDDAPPVTLFAREAQLRLNDDKTKLMVLLTDPSADFRKGVQADFPGQQEFEISLSAAARKGGSSTDLSNSAMQEIPRHIEGQRQEIRRLQQHFAAEAAYQMLTGDFQALSDPSWHQRQLQLQDAQSQLFKLKLVPWRRWANGFSCLFFVLVGAPLAVRLRNADMWTSFGLCFLPILLIYYPLLMYGLDRAKCGALPPYFIWLGNAVLLGASCWILRKVMRY